MTDNPVHRQALVYAGRGWPVFPCQPGRKTPATAHGYLDATTDPAKISEWFARSPGLNLAIATGAPGPDVLDIDSHGGRGNGYDVIAELRTSGLLDDISTTVQTPNGGLHLYLLGSDQRCGHLPARHVDFLAHGGYVLAPPSRVSDRPYIGVPISDAGSWLDWTAAARQLSPDRPPLRPDTGARQAENRPRPNQISVLARWLAIQREGNRNSGLFWAANRALENDLAADLTPLVTAARQAGLDNSEIARTLHSARRTTQAALTRETPDREPEGGS